MKRRAFIPIEPLRRAPRLLRGADSDFGACDAIPPAQRRAMRVLVVEDDPVQGMLLMLFLDRFGVAASLVTDGQQAVNAVQSGPFTLVLMDFLLPVVNGIEATLAIRRWERRHGRAPVPIVAVTASCMVEQCQRYLDCGMDRVLRKPYSAREFGQLLVHYTLATHAGTLCNRVGDFKEAVDVACACGR
jgi:CheY-like chemotaxis protein